MLYDFPYEIQSFLNDVFEIIQIRGRVGSENGIEFVVHTNEQNHSLPHIHAKYGNYKISILIETSEVLVGNLPPKQTNVAQKWVKDNKSKLLNDWKTIAISANSEFTKSLLDR